MTRIGGFDQIMVQARRKNEAARKRVGWYQGYEYRVNTADLMFSAEKGHCGECGEYHHILPFEGGWIRPTTPLRLAKNWSEGHNITVTVERRKCRYHHALGKRALGTWEDRVEPVETEWTIWRILSPSATIPG